MCMSFTSTWPEPVRSRTKNKDWRMTRGRYTICQVAKMKCNCSPLSVGFATMTRAKEETKTLGRVVRGLHSKGKWPRKSKFPRASSSQDGPPPKGRHPWAWGPLLMEGDGEGATLGWKAFSALDPGSRSILIRGDGDVIGSSRRMRLGIQGFAFPGDSPLVQKQYGGFNVLWSSKGPRYPKSWRSKGAWCTKYEVFACRWQMPSHWFQV